MRDSSKYFPLVMERGEVAAVLVEAGKQRGGGRRERDAVVPDKDEVASLELVAAVALAAQQGVEKIGWTRRVCACERGGERGEKEANVQKGQ